MSESKQQILAALRAHLPQATELPRLDQQWLQFEDRITQFETVLRSVGGDFRLVTSRTQAESILEEIAASLQARKICSQVPDLGQPTFHLADVSDPHELEDVDLAILPGQFGVAENGAVWVEGDSLIHRTILFIAQHVVLVVSTEHLLNNMHEAYQQLNWAGRSFGVFVSGPSKTADIEQSLVIGAHGARSLTVLLTNFSETDTHE